MVALQDWKATLELFQSQFCKLDWRLVAPVSLAWRFDGEQSVDMLKETKGA